MARQGNVADALNLLEARELIEMKYELTPENERLEPKNLVDCRCFSFSKMVFSGSMFVFQGVWTITADDSEI